MSAKEFPLLPEQYLQVTDNSSGQTYIMAIGDDEPLVLEALVDRWVLSEFCDELAREGELTESWAGHYHAAIKTDNRPLDSPIVWESAGFYCETTYR
jgi:hypothetical protein